MTLKIQDIMEAKFTSVPLGSQMGSLEAQMSMGDVRHILVVDEQGRLAGIFSRSDLRRAQDKGSRGSVNEYMTRRMWTVRVTDEAVKAADVMIQHHVGGVPVVDEEDKPLGLISDFELLKMARAQLAIEPAAA